MKNRLYANRMFDFLSDLKNEGYDLETIEVNIKQDDGDVINAWDIEEDLFDSESNSILESIVINGCFDDFQPLEG